MKPSSSERALAERQARPDFWRERLTRRRDVAFLGGYLLDELCIPPFDIERARQEYAELSADLTLTDEQRKFARLFFTMYAKRQRRLDDLQAKPLEDLVQRAQHPARSRSSRIEGTVIRRPIHLHLLVDPATYTMMCGPTTSPSGGYFWNGRAPELTVGRATKYADINHNTLLHEESHALYAFFTELIYEPTFQKTLYRAPMPKIASLKKRVAHEGFEGPFEAFQEDLLAHGSAHAKDEVFAYHRTKEGVGRIHELLSKTTTQKGLYDYFQESLEEIMRDLSLHFPQERFTIEESFRTFRARYATRLREALGALVHFERLTRATPMQSFVYFLDIPLERWALEVETLQALGL